MTELLLLPLGVIVGFFFTTGVLVWARRLSQTRKERQISNYQLRRIASAYPPPSEWFEQEEERPF